MNIKFACWSIAAGLALISATCVAAGKDEMWEITAKIEMEDFAMPAQTSKVCIPKGQEKDPNRSVPNDKNCKMSEAKVSGNKMSWKMKCEGKDAMSGSGEMVYGDGTYSGKLKMHSEDGDMVMAYNGKRVGSCDVAVENKRMEEMVQAPIKAMRAEVRAECKEVLDKGGYSMIDNYSASGLSSHCADMKKSMCDKVRALSSEYAGYEALVKQEKIPAATRNLMKTYDQAHVTGPLSAECGLDMAKIGGTVCQKAKGEGRAKYDFLAEHCPSEAQVLAKQLCESWGRDYTADYLSSTYHIPICKKYSKNKIRYQVADETVDDESADSSGEKEGVIGKLFGGKSEESAGADAKKPQDSKTGEKTDNPAGAVLEGAKKLKGLFGF